MSDTKDPFDEYMENEYQDDNYEDACNSLIPVNETQVACDGIDLIDMLNYSESVDEHEKEIFTRLGLTYTVEHDEMLDFDIRHFNELSEEKCYLLTFPEGADLADFDIADVLAIEEIPQETYNDLFSAYNETPCDGDCENCSQDCIGKEMPF